MRDAELPATCEKYGDIESMEDTDQNTMRQRNYTLESSYKAREMKAQQSKDISGELGIKSIRLPALSEHEQAPNNTTMTFDQILACRTSHVTKELEI